MRKLKVYFEDFWPNFDLTDNFFYRILSKYYNIEISKDKPDILFHSVYTSNFLNYNCLKILYSGENYRPNFEVDDFAITFDFLKNPNHLRVPLFYLRADNINIKRIPEDDVLNNKFGFCSFVVSNPMCLKRIKFFKKLSKYKKVDSGGKVLNNIGYYLDQKHEFIQQYKFNIAFENSSYPGYTTEKISDAFLGSSIPIYWGNPLVHLDFNPKSFINYHEFKNENELIDYIIYLDENDDKYIEMYRKFDLEDFNIKTKLAINQLEEFIINAINQYIDFGITKSKYNNASQLNKQIIIQKYKIKAFFKYYIIALEHISKSKLLINKI